MRSLFLLFTQVAQFEYMNKFFFANALIIRRLIFLASHLLNMKQDFVWASLIRVLLSFIYKQVAAPLVYIAYMGSVFKWEGWVENSLNPYQ